MSSAGSSTVPPSDRKPVRVLLVTGKGGVGKTTTAASTALELASRGHRVVVTSADPAHSLSDSFDLALGPVPVEVAPNCAAQQIDARERFEEHWAEIRHWLLEVFDWAGVDSIEAEELAVLPGLDELFALTEIESLCASGEFDVVVVDCGPTAETIRLLSLPDVIGWYMDRLFPASRRLHRVVAPVLSRVGRLPVADDTVFAAGQRLYDRLESVHGLLSDPAITSARLVVNPERMVVAEARRTFTQLSLFGYQVDAVIVNRLLSDEVSDSWFESWRAAHAEHLETIEADFAPVPVLRSHLAASDVVGVDALTRFGSDLWARQDPAARLIDHRPIRLHRIAEGFELEVDLPFTVRDQVDLSRSGDELLVTLGAHRRALALPEALRRRQVTDATVMDGALRVRFLDVG